MTAKKKVPAFELGQLLINQVQDYLGPRTINKLTPLQLGNISRCCNVVAETIGEILVDDSDELRTLTPALIKLTAVDVHLVQEEEQKKIEHKPE